ncbi:hypothetical protein [Streptomyces sp. NPDC101150]|uniref:hypothetical protein n=1 Tax=Streptomyces sp. NPDC101150 TaxID=3366114 RepID=UPI0037FD1B5C
MDDQANSLDIAADEVGDIKAEILDPYCASLEDLGGPDTGPAYLRFSAAWQAEAETLKGALGETADKIRTSNANYHSADEHTVASLTKAAAATSGPPSVSTLSASNAGPTPFG